MKYSEGTLIRKLCMDCRHRKELCGRLALSYVDAYRCKWREAQREFRKMDGAFEGDANEQKNTNQG